MISQGLKMLKRAIDERPKDGMLTGMPRIQLRESDAVRAVAELEWARQRIIELEQQRNHAIEKRDELAATVERTATGTYRRTEKGHRLASEFEKALEHIGWWYG